MNVTRATMRFGTWREPGVPVVAAMWAVVAALVLWTNLGTGGTLRLDGDALRYDGDAIGIRALDYGEQTKAQWEASVREDPARERVEQVVVSSYALVSDKRTFYALAVAQMLTIIGGAFCLERLVRRAARRQAFADQNHWWLRLLALFVALGALVVPLLIHAFEDHVITREATASDGAVTVERLSHGPGQAPFVIVLVLLLFAEVWRRGMRLRDDVEATV